MPTRVSHWHFGVGFRRYSFKILRSAGDSFARAFSFTFTSSDSSLKMVTGSTSVLCGASLHLSELLQTLVRHLDS